MGIVLYGRRLSFEVQKVLWLLDELGITYEHIELGNNPEETSTTEFKNLNPMQKIPVLKDGDKVIWESNSILRYLSGEYGDKDWREDDPYSQSLYERWMDWSQTFFEPAFIGVFWGYYRTPPELRNMDEVYSSLETCRNCLEKLEGQLSGKKYLAGDDITLADISAGVLVFRLVEVGLDIVLPENVENWYSQLKLREGYRTWVMSDFSSLRGQ